MHAFARKLTAATLLTAGLLLGGCGKDSREAEKVTFNMSWLPQGSMAGVILAIDKGFYAEEGLVVEAVRGFGGIRTANELDQGMFQFGYADPLAVILNRANGGTARMIGAISDRWPAGLCFIKERHKVESPADLAGMVVGGGQNSPMQVLVPAWLDKNGVDKGKVTLMQLDPAVVVASLVEGKIDAGECWLGNSLPLFRRRAEEAGLSLGWLAYADFNLDIYGNGLISSDKVIKERPEQVRAFLKATYRGYAAALADPDAAVAVMLKHYPVLDASITKQQLLETGALLKQQARAGWMEADRVAGTLDFLRGAYGLKADVQVGDVFTTDYLPQP